MVGVGVKVLYLVLNGSGSGMVLAVGHGSKLVMDGFFGAAWEDGFRLGSEAWKMLGYITRARATGRLDIKMTKNGGLGEIWRR